MLELLYEALASRYGIIVATNNPEALRQQLYKARREAADPDLQQLSIRISPLLPKQEVWIVRNAQGS